MWILSDVFNDAHVIASPSHNRTTLNFILHYNSARASKLCVPRI